MNQPKPSEDSWRDWFAEAEGFFLSLFGPTIVVVVLFAALAVWLAAGGRF